MAIRNVEERFTRKADAERRLQRSNEALRAQRKAERITHPSPLDDTSIGAVRYALVTRVEHTDAPGTHPPSAAGFVAATLGDDGRYRMSDGMVTHLSNAYNSTRKKAPAPDGIPAEHILRLTDVARLMGIKPDRLDRAITNHHLKGIQSGGPGTLWEIDYEEWLRWLPVAGYSDSLIARWSAAWHAWGQEEPAPPGK